MLNISLSDGVLGYGERSRTSPYMSRLKKRKIERVIPGDILNFGLKNNLSITVNF